MKSHFLPILAIGLLAPAGLLLAPGPVQAQNASQTQDHPFLHALFSDDAVLQRDRVIPVWGWTNPGGSVTVQLDNSTTATRANALGKWMAHIGPHAAGGPHTLTVTGAGDGENVTRRNILFGDVWLCSGQSNMEMGIGQVNDAQQEIAAANYPNIRLFVVPKRGAATPQDTLKSQWLVCNPTNIAQGPWSGFSAVAYFFGRKLNQELEVPIGLIQSAWGATVAEVWVSESALGTLPDFRQDIADLKAATRPSPIPLDQRVNQWLTTNDPNASANWIALDADDAAWKTMNVPGNWETTGIQGLGNFDGIVLFRREVDVPPEWAGQDLTLSLCGIDDSDVTYWNGVQVGSASDWTNNRQYKIPGAQVKAGRNVIAVRVTDTGGEGGFRGSPDQMRLRRGDAVSISLDGLWKYRIGVPLANMKSMPRAFDSNNINQVNVLYNGMIAPLEPFGIKGAIWYQGEGNAVRADQYRRLLPRLIEDWRKHFGKGMPFYIVQLAGFMAPDESPRNDDWPRLRAAQFETAQTVGNSGIAVTIDIGDQNDIHPKNKQDVGLRLALSALAQTYGKKVKYMGPTVKSVTPRNGQLVVNFVCADGGLTLKGDANRVFAIAGADRNWFWATPRIEKNKVFLSSPAVPNPKYARYAWSNLPRATLYNAAGLPAPPFQNVPK